MEVPLVNSEPDPDSDPVNKKPVKRTRYCLLANFVSLTVIAVCIFAFGSSDSTYLRFGPSPSLFLAGFAVSTWTRWALSVALIVVISVVDTITVEFGMPFISFRIYDPDVKEIRDVGPIELQILANGMYACTSLKQVIYTLAVVTQLDFALVRVVTNELTSVFTIRSLIRSKTFYSS